MTEWIVLELMTGLSSGEKASTLLAKFEGVEYLPLPDGGWRTAWNLAAQLRKQGVSPSAADCFIATVASVTIRHSSIAIRTSSDRSPLGIANGELDRAFAMIGGQLAARPDFP